MSLNRDQPGFDLDADVKSVEDALESETIRRLPPYKAVQAA